MAVRLPFQDIHRPHHPSYVGNRQEPEVPKKHNVSIIYHSFITSLTMIYHVRATYINIYWNIFQPPFDAAFPNRLYPAFIDSAARAQRAQRAALPGLVVLDVDAPWFASCWWSLGESPNWKKGHPAIPPASQRVHRNSGMKLMKRWDLLIFSASLGWWIFCISLERMLMYCQNILSKYKLWWTIG